MLFPRQISIREPQFRTFLLIAGCICALVVFRLLRTMFFPELPNFSALAAVAFCGGLFLRGVVAWILPMAAVIASDLALSLFFGYPMGGSWQATTWACTLGLVALGRWLASDGALGIGKFFTMLVSGSVLFYLVTNAISWMGNPAYPRGLDGLVMSLTVGLPGFPPTWMFFRNSLVSDLIFGTLILAVYVLSRQPNEHASRLARAKA